MKVTDLMLGDWVSINGKQVWVWTLTQHGVVGYMDGDHSYYSSEDDVEPIPLTAEILEKNGLVVGDFPMHFAEDKDFDLELSMYGSEVWWTINLQEYDIIKLGYVHELQHVLKDCKIKKEIVL